MRKRWQRACETARESANQLGCQIVANPLRSSLSDVLLVDDIEN
jgi:hypothetical protein